MKFWTAIVSLLTLLACDHSSALRYTESREVSIAYLKSLCHSTVCDITTDLTISGTVIATDWLGEYYKSIVVIDPTGGIEIDIDSQSLFRQIPVYSRVTIFCNGLSLARAGGTVVLGSHPTGDYVVDAIDAALLARYIRIDSTSGESLAPTEKRIAEIGAGDAGKYVIIRNITITERGNGRWCDFDSERGTYISTLRRVADRDGNAFALYTLGVCDYADEALPEGEFSAAGIVEYAGGEFRLRVVNHSIL